MSHSIPKAKKDCNPQNKVFLKDFSPEHQIWDEVKKNSELIALAYLSNPELERYGQKVSACSEWIILNFCRVGNEIVRRVSAMKCRVRHCPICQRARSMKLLKQMQEGLDLLVKDYPKNRWVFLTLTVPNCSMEELKDVLTEMNKAWQRLIKRKEFAIVKGWLRSTEVTKGKGEENTAHPHFHILLFVPSYYFGNGYIKQEIWAEIWKSCMRLEVTPIVDVRAVKDLEGGLKEVIKVAHYSVKPTEISKDPEWFVEFHKQVFKKRFLAKGGLLKEYLKSVKEEEDDEEGEEGEIIVEGVRFNWDKEIKRYAKNG
jgi:plasmid rolling circle replication initiator protein Rep